jgi:hypothetical protein
VGASAGGAPARATPAGQRALPRMPSTYYAYNPAAGDNVSLHDGGRGRETGGGAHQIQHSAGLGRWGRWAGPAGDLLCVDPWWPGAVLGRALAAR